MPVHTNGTTYWVGHAQDPGVTVMSYPSREALMFVKAHRGDDDETFARAIDIWRRQGTLYSVSDPKEGRVMITVDTDLDLLEMAWGIIANASGGDWSKASPGWCDAAERWRDKYHARLTQPSPERRAVIAYLCDAAEQYVESSGYRAFIADCVGDIAEGEHVLSMAHGEYDDMRERLDLIAASHPRKDQA